MFIKVKCNSCDGIYESLDVRFTKKCDNDCEFCIEKKNNYNSTEEVSIDDMILSTIESGIKEVLILGGEPFITPKRLYDYVVGIRDHVNKIYITTSLPKIMKTSPYVKQILSLVDGLTISVQHYDWKENNNILKASHYYNRFDVIEKLCEDFSHKIRVSINLVKGGIDSKAKLELLFIRMANLGVENIKINELSDSPELYVSYEKMYNSKLDSAYATGCQTEVKNDYATGLGLNVILKRSCFLVEESLNASWKDLLKICIRQIAGKKSLVRKRFAVLYENGKISNRWLKGE